MNKEKLNILGVNVSTLDRQEILKRIDAFLMSSKVNFLVTINPEIILQAMKDEEYFIMINNVDLSVPDGAGLTFAAWALFKNIHRFPGVDLTEVLLAKAETENIKVAIFVWNKGLTHSHEIKAVLKNKYPKLNFICQEIDRDVKAEMNSEVGDFAPQIAFVAVGSPWQEKIIYHQLLKKDYIRLALGVGGTFDFLSGKVARAPKIMRALGLEWIWRVFNQTKGGRMQRLHRIYNAFIVFTLKYLNWRFIQPFLYRPNVACLLYKREGGKYKILIVRRSDLNNEHWQLPQGGTDGLNIETAGKKELEEEVGIKNIKTIGVFKNLHHYEFDREIMQKNNPSHPSRHTGYKGQKQSLYIAEFLGQDNDIKINYWDHNGWKWVDADNLINEIHAVRREGYGIYLEKFKQCAK
jgi:N-acetylglucosaminyldiphosphoundecaprenol N-acetyl-beta-D-mannosaminyltransferase